MMNAVILNCLTLNISQAPFTTVRQLMDPAASDSEASRVFEWCTKTANLDFSYNF